MLHCIQKCSGKKLTYGKLSKESSHSKCKCHICLNAFIPSKEIIKVATRIQLLHVCYEDEEVKQLDGEIARKKETLLLIHVLTKRGRTDKDSDK